MLLDDNEADGGRTKIRGIKERFIRRGTIEFQRCDSMFKRLVVLLGTCQPLPVRLPFRTWSFSMRVEILPVLVIGILIFKKLLSYKLFVDPALSLLSE